MGGPCQRVISTLNRRGELIEIWTHNFPRWARFLCRIGGRRLVDRLHARDCTMERWTIVHPTLAAADAEFDAARAALDADLPPGLAR